VQPKNLAFGGGAAQSAVNPFVLLIVLILGVMILTKPRDKAISLFLFPAMLIPMIDQVLVLGGVHFPMIRVLLLFGIARMIRAKATGESVIFTGGMTRLDKTVILFMLVTFVNGLLLWRDTGYLVKELGEIYTVFGTYFLMRYLIRDNDDSEKAIRALFYIAVIVAAIMTYEQATGRNPYALLGGAKADFYGALLVREDRLRAVAGFGHALLAGTFGAIVMPLFVSLWLKDKKNLKLAATGLIACAIIVWASASSTPMLAYAGGLMALCMWPLRELMRPIRWGIVITLVTLHMVMKSPVWQLIDRMSIVGGSSGYHRYQLVDQCIRHFSDWWLYGVKDTGAWGWDMWDTANQYVSIADSTGLLPFILFIAILTYGFKYVVAARKAAVGNKNMQLYYWALGCALFANAIGFFGISYWDQTMVVWYTFLAIIGAAYLTVSATASVPAVSTATAPAQTPAPALISPPRPAYVPKASTATSYGRMITGRFSPRSTTTK
jgi:hypothetical protein